MLKNMLHTVLVLFNKGILFVVDLSIFNVYCWFLAALIPYEYGIAKSVCGFHE